MCSHPGGVLHNVPSHIPVPRFSSSLRKKVELLESDPKPLATRMDAGFRHSKTRSVSLSDSRIPQKLEHFLTVSLHSKMPKNASKTFFMLHTHFSLQHPGIKLNPENHLSEFKNVGRWRGVGARPWWPAQLRPNQPHQHVPLGHGRLKLLVQFLDASGQFCGICVGLTH